MAVLCRVSGRGRPVCNGIADCADGSDEVGCTTTVAVTTTRRLTGCKGNVFICADFSMCVPNRYKCNGFKDCRDGSDEDGCTTTTEDFCGRDVQLSACINQGATGLMAQTLCPLMCGRCVPTTSTTSITTTTYERQSCNGVLEAVSCGTRIPQSDCTLSGELEQYAKQECPQMCGLVCSTSTTATSSTVTPSTVTVTSTTKTATEAEAETTSTQTATTTAKLTTQTSTSTKTAESPGGSTTTSTATVAGTIVSTAAVDVTTSNAESPTEDGGRGNVEGFPDYYWAAAAGAVVVLLICLVLCCCCASKDDKDKDNESGEAGQVGQVGQAAAGTIVINHSSQNQQPAPAAPAAINVVVHVNNSNDSDGEDSDSKAEKEESKPKGKKKLSAPSKDNDDYEMSKNEFKDTGNPDWLYGHLLKEDVKTLFSNAGGKDGTFLVCESPQPTTFVLHVVFRG
eukprot:gene12520-5066_t